MNIFTKIFSFVAVIILFTFFGVTAQAQTNPVGAALSRPNSIFISGNYAYIVSEISEALEIVDISNPAVPTHKGALFHGTDGAYLYKPSDVFVSGNYAYVISAYGNVLEIVDVSDPANPIHKNIFSSGEDGSRFIGPSSVVVSGHYLYIVAHRSQNIEILDISDPIYPTHAGSIYFGTLTYPSSIFISDHYAYVTVPIIGQNGGSLSIIDIANPASPFVVGRIYNGTDGALISYPTSVTVSNGYAYITSAADGYGLEIVDVSDPANPTHKGKIYDGEGGANIFFPMHVTISGNHAFIASYVGSAMEIIDVSNPTNPVHKGTISDGDGGAALSYPVSLSVSGDYAYVASSFSDALEIVDISNPANPKHKSKLLNGQIQPPEPEGCVVDCFSNVLFLPGLQASRLYRQIGFEDCIPTQSPNNCKQDLQLWFSMEDDNHELLLLDEHGKSSDTVNIYTKNDTEITNEGEDETGILDEAESVNIYKSFLSDLKDWKDEGIISDYAFIPYDWRLSLEDIISNAKVEGDRLTYTDSQDFSESFILQKLEELQQSSKTGKVIIVAHSNGGLVTKALVQKLKDTNNPLYDKIDKVIFVAVPQIGTPEALMSLLHGINLGPGGIVMSNERSRQLSENMPGVYSLLPSASYFTTVDSAFAVDKLVSFENKPFFSPQTSQYGVYVSNETELKDYVLGTDNRIKPSFSDTLHPNIGNSALYTQAQNMHQVLDSWIPSPDTKVIQIAGWGEETLVGIDYKLYTSNIFGDKKLSYKPRYVVDGDSTVVVPSALWMSESNPNVERWWVDLDKYNSLKFRLINLNLKRDHKDILEVSSLRDLIKSKVKNEIQFNDSKDVILDTNLNLISNKPRLHFTLHSPLTLGINSQGKYTGLDPVTKRVREEIPGVTYKQIGEVQFLSVSNDVSGAIELHGYELGNFSLDVDKQEGNIITESTSFQGIPSSTSTFATVDIALDPQISNIVLKVDTDGNNTIDFNLLAKLDGVVTMPKYTFPGFLQPINDTGFHLEQSSSVFKAGSTIPVKFQLKNLNEAITEATSAPIWLPPVILSSMSATIDETIYSLPATIGNEFKWDPVSQQYIYNWSTKGFQSGKWYKISIKLDDGYVYSVKIGLK